jgi:hypothetical protein
MRPLLLSPVLALLTACSGYHPKTVVVTDSSGATIANPGPFVSSGSVAPIITELAPPPDPLENSLIGRLFPAPKPRVYVIEKSALQQKRSESFANPFGHTGDITDFHGDKDPRLNLSTPTP